MIASIVFQDSEDIEEYIVFSISVDSFIEYTGLLEVRIASSEKLKLSLSQKCRNIFFLLL